VGRAAGKKKNINSPFPGKHQKRENCPPDNRVFLPWGERIGAEGGKKKLEKEKWPEKDTISSPPLRHSSFAKRGKKKRSKERKRRILREEKGRNLEATRKTHASTSSNATSRQSKREEGGKKQEVWKRTA